MTRLGFGAVEKENEESDTKQYENGHIEVSSKAFKRAMSEYRNMPLAGALACMLFDEAEVDYVVNPESPDHEAINEALQAVDGIGEETASEATEAVLGAL